MSFSDRIIAGVYKGRALVLPADDAVRPTKNRVRQAVFNMLGSRLDWDGLRVVDLCCGSGAWGLEALSRGAAEVVLVDRDVKVAEANAQALGVGAQVEVVKSEVGAWVSAAPFDVVLADPPYALPLAQRLLARAGELGGNGSWWAMETAPSTQLDWAGFEEVVHRDYGGSRIWVGKQR